MNAKVIDFRKTVHDLCNEDSELLLILAQLGFTEIIKPGMLATAGRFMTIPKGAKVKNIDIALIKKEFTRLGYEVIEK